MILRQSKAPLQLDSDTQISLEDTIFSTYATWWPVLPHQATEPRAGVEFVIEDIAKPQSSALPTPDFGRTFGMPLVVTRRYAT